MKDPGPAYLAACAYMAETRAPRKRKYVHISNIQFNRLTDPPEVFAIAERIKETRDLLRQLNKEKKR